MGGRLSGETAVVVNDYVPDSAKNASQDIVNMRRSAVPCAGEVTQFDIAHKLVQKAVSEFGRVDILVNNAGTFTSSRAWETTEEEWDKCVNSSLKGAFNCGRHACGIMKRQGWGYYFTLKEFR
jgi:NAD(P)-dependent dehydrogenase (short-subunit alcohol dehydrogenase family)